jgi:hypothetical protein
LVFDEFHEVQSVCLSSVFSGKFQIAPNRGRWFFGWVCLCSLENVRNRHDLLLVGIHATNLLIVLTDRLS